MSFKNQDWTFVIQTIKLSKGITRSYKLRIPQTLQSWKGYSQGFPTISRTTPNLHWARSYSGLEFAKNSLLGYSKISRFPYTSQK